MPIIKATQEIEKRTGLPNGYFPAIVEEHALSGEDSLIPSWRRTAETDQNELISGAVRFSQKLKEFNGNKPLAIAAYKFGDKLVTNSLATGFAKDMVNYTANVLSRAAKYNGEQFGDKEKAELEKALVQKNEMPEKKPTQWLSYHNQQAIRNKPLSDKLINAMSFLNGTGIEMKVFSGGQTGKRRTGSTRHDYGNAADVEFYKNGRKLSFKNDEDRAVLMEITRQASLRGVTGIGAGSGNGDYMGDGRIHLGFGKRATWGAKGKGKNAPAWLKQATANGNATFADLGGNGAADSGGNSISVAGVEFAQGKRRVYTLADGTQQIREGGTRAWRNNNEGNLRYGDFAKKHGAIGQDEQGFAVFPSEEVGTKAKGSLLFDTSTYKKLTLQQALNRYAPPSENNTNMYYATVLKAVGSNKRMSEYSPEERQRIMGAMRQVEGWRAGTINGTQQEQYASSGGYTGGGYAEYPTTQLPNTDVGTGSFIDSSQPQTKTADDIDAELKKLAREVFSNSSKRSEPPRTVKQAIRGALKGVV